MTALSVAKAFGHCRSVLALNRLLIIFALIMGIVRVMPAQVQDPSQTGSTALDEWIRGTQHDLIRDSTEHLLDQFKIDPALIDLGKSQSTQDLQFASFQRSYSALSVLNYESELESAKGSVEALREVESDLQSQLREASNTTNVVQSARIGEISSKLSQIDLTLKQATASQQDLEAGLASARSGFQQAQRELQSAERQFSLWDRVAPGYNFVASNAFNVGTQLSDTLDLFKAAENPRQEAEFNVKAADYFFTHILAPLGCPECAAAATLNEQIHNAEMMSKAFDYNREAQSLAFGGALSMARPSEIQIDRANFDVNNGSFHAFGVGNRGSLSGSWNASYGNTNDTFQTASQFAFNNLQTVSGHVLSVSGDVSRKTVEFHAPFEHNPLLNVMNVFTSNPESENVTTYRNETTHDSFNGALVNQGILRSIEYNNPPSVEVSPVSGFPQAVVFRPPPNTSLQFSTPTPALFDQDTLKLPPSVSLPPPSPPRPLPTALSTSILETSSQLTGLQYNNPPRGGVCMTSSYEVKADSDFGDGSPQQTPDTQSQPPAPTTPDCTPQEKK